MRLETGEVLQKLDIPAQYFGEGIVNWHSHLISLTWKSEVGFVFDLATFKQQRQFHYDGEGWALTQDGKQILMSDGTPQMRYINPQTLKETGRIRSPWTASRFATSMSWNGSRGRSTPMCGRPTGSCASTRTMVTWSA